MASQDPNAVMPASAHPMANPGYGKRSAPDQSPSRSDGFDHLSPRERYVAAFIDRLPDGAAMDAKTLAKVLPLYGQQAVRTVLNELSRAGHLRRVRRRAEGAATGDAGERVTRWVFRTCWSRTARDSEWWARFLAGDVPDDVPYRPSATGGRAPAAEAVPAVVQPEEAQRAERAERADQVQQADRAAQPHRADQADPPQPATRHPRPSAAYETLARLGRTESRLALSAADCAALEELASVWLARGATTTQLTQSLVAGLPEQVHSPRAFLQRRLSDKMPPELPAPEEHATRAIPECTDCGVPGRPEALPDGLCRACRGASHQAGSPLPPPATGRSRGDADGPHRSPQPLSADDVHLRAARIRSAFADRRTTALPGSPVSAGG
ncbi:hypothetical protein ACLQ18_27765 [Streptomyces sp. DT193]|uniref:hypothetical protein n=1 Tax=Streptomyces sp. DT193 TaxID=3393418 RepID=UPI003CEEFC8E